jgi:hypothetical protein
MSTTESIIALSAPVAIEAKAQRVPTFEATIYTGGALTLNGWDMPVVIDLVGLTTGNVLVANLDHDSTKRVGNFTVANDGSSLKARGVASAATPYRDEVIASAKAGYTWQASVEVQPQSVEPIKAGAAVVVNNRSITGPAYITRRGILKGFAFVSHGADDNTHVAIAAQQRTKRMSAASFNAWVSEMGIDTELMTSEQLAGLHANYEGRSNIIGSDREADAPMIVASAPGDPVEAEQKRMRQIEAACRGEWGDDVERLIELKALAVGGNLSVDDLLSELRQIRMNQTMNSLSVAPPRYRGNRDMQPQVVEAAFCLAAGLPGVEAQFPEQVLDVADKMRRDVGLQGLLMRAACENGYQAKPAESITHGNLRQVMQAAFAPIRAAGFSTASVSNILSNVGNKFLLDGWQETSGDEWRKISEVKPVKDFKANTFYRLLEAAEYEQVGPAGEIKHGTLGEQSMTVTANTYGRMYAITRTDIINDDLGALTDIPRRLGRAAGMKFRRIFWTAFLASDSFWDAGNGNVVTGSGTALTSAGTALQTALTAFRAMRTSTADGRKLIGGKPAFLLVPPALELVGRQLLNSSAIVATGDTDTTMGNANVFAGLAELLVCDWLSDSDMGGAYSAAKWYLLRSPNIAPAMLVAFLNGQQSPTVETADADFNTLGIQMRGYHDFGVGRGEPLCGLQVAGQA